MNKKRRLAGCLLLLLSASVGRGADFPGRPKHSAGGSGWGTVSQGRISGNPDSRRSPTGSSGESDRGTLDPERRDRIEGFTPAGDPGDKFNEGFGECVDFAKWSRPDLKNELGPVGAAKNMAVKAAEKGFAVTREPREGSVLVLPEAGKYGHAAVVTGVRRDPKTDGVFELTVRDANADNRSRKGIGSNVEERVIRYDSRTQRVTDPRHPGLSGANGRGVSFIHEKQEKFDLRRSQRETNTRTAGRIPGGEARPPANPVAAAVEDELRGLEISPDLRETSGALDAIRKNLVNNEVGFKAYGRLKKTEGDQYDAALRALNGASRALNRGDEAEAKRLIGKARRLKFKMRETGREAAIAFAGSVREGYEKYASRLDAGGSLAGTFGGVPGKVVGMTLKGVGEALRIILDYDAKGLGGAARGFAIRGSEDVVKQILGQLAQSALPPAEIWKVAEAALNAWKFGAGKDLDLSRTFSSELKKAVRRKTAEARRPAQRRRETKNALKRESRREHFEDRRLEERADRFLTLDRASDLQLSKSVIDAHGFRVRMDAYVIRPAPHQTEHWVLNHREHRFDYVALKRSFAQPLGSLAEAFALEQAVWSGFASPPANYMTRREIVASNGIDHILWTMDLAAPVFTNTTWGKPYLPAMWADQMRLQGPGYDKAKREFIKFNNLNSYRFISRVPDAAGALATYTDHTYDRSTFVCSPCTTNTAVEPVYEGQPFDGANTTRYRDGTFTSWEFWMLKDDGTHLPLNGIIQIGDNINFEERFRATELQGRDIDFIYPSRFFFQQTQEQTSPP